MTTNSKFTWLTSDILSELHLRRFCSNNSFAALAVPCTCSSNQNRRWCNRRIFAWFLLQDNNSSCRCLELTYSYFRWLEQLKSRMKSRKLDIAYLFYSKNVWIWQIIWIVSLAISLINKQRQARSHPLKLKKKQNVLTFAVSIENSSVIHAQLHSSTLTKSRFKKFKQIWILKKIE